MSTIGVARHALADVVLTWFDIVLANLAVFDKLDAIGGKRKEVDTSTGIIEDCAENLALVLAEVDVMGILGCVIIKMDTGSAVLFLDDRKIELDGLVNISASGVTGFGHVVKTGTGKHGKRNRRNQCVFNSEGHCALPICWSQVATLTLLVAIALPGLHLYIYVESRLYLHPAQCRGLPLRTRLRPTPTDG